MKKLILLFIIISQFQTTNAQSWLWAKNGISDRSSGLSVTTDANGNSYAVGCFGSDSIIFGSFKLKNAHTAPASNDIFIVKYSPNGTVIWAKSFGTIGKNSSEVAYGITSDKFGNLYFVGRIQGGSILFDTITLSTFGSSAFIVKMNTNGNVIWAKQSSGSQAYASGVATDLSGNVFVAGSFNDNDLYFGSHKISNQSPSGQTDDVFLVKYDGNGSVLWAKSGGGINEDEDDFASSVAIDDEGSSYITGAFWSKVLKFGAFTLSGISTFYPNYFLVKYDSSGNEMWAKTTDYGRAQGESIATDKLNNILVGGYVFDSTASIGSYPLALINNIFIAKYDKNGNFNWAKQQNGGNIWSSKITTDKFDNIYISGSFYGTVSFGSSLLTADPGFYLAKYDNNGNAIWGKSALLNTGNSNYVNGISVDFNEDIIIAGVTGCDSVDFGNILLTNNSPTFIYSDFFIAKLSPTVGISDILMENSLYNIYPNPTSNVFSIYFYKPLKNVSIKLFNNLGEEIFIKHFSTMVNSKQEIELKGRAGIYFIQVTDGTETWTQKLIKE